MNQRRPLPPLLPLRPTECLAQGYQKIKSSRFKSNLNPAFRSKFSEDIFNHKYRHEGAETWDALAKTLVDDVCGDLLSPEEVDQLTTYIREMKFIPGGRYLYYAGRPNKFFNNCYNEKSCC